MNNQSRWTPAYKDKWFIALICVFYVISAFVCIGIGYEIGSKNYTEKMEHKGALKQPKWEYYVGTVIKVVPVESSFTLNGKIVTRLVDYRYTISFNSTFALTIGGEGFYKVDENSASITVIRFFDVGDKVLVTYKNTSVFSYQLIESGGH